VGPNKKRPGGRPCGCGRGKDVEGDRVTRWWGRDSPIAKPRGRRERKARSFHASQTQKETRGRKRKLESKTERGGRKGIILFLAKWACEKKKGKKKKKIVE